MENLADALYQSFVPTGYLNVTLEFSPSISQLVDILSQDNTLKEKANPQLINQMKNLIKNASIVLMLSMGLPKDQFSKEKISIMVHSSCLAQFYLDDIQIHLSNLILYINDLKRSLDTAAPGNPTAEQINSSGFALFSALIPIRAISAALDSLKPVFEGFINLPPISPDMEIVCQKCMNLIAFADQIQTQASTFQDFSQAQAQLAAAVSELIALIPQYSNVFQTLKYRIIEKFDRLFTNPKFHQFTQYLQILTAPLMHIVESGIIFSLRSPSTSSSYMQSLNAIVQTVYDLVRHPISIMRFRAEFEQTNKLVQEASQKIMDQLRNILTDSEEFSKLGFGQFGVIMYQRLSTSFQQFVQTQGQYNTRYDAMIQALKDDTSYIIYSPVTIENVTDLLAKEAVLAVEVCLKLTENLFSDNVQLPECISCIQKLSPLTTQLKQKIQDSIDKAATQSEKVQKAAILTSINTAMTNFTQSFLAWSKNQVDFFLQGKACYNSLAFLMTFFNVGIDYSLDIPLFTKAHQLVEKMLIACFNKYVLPILPVLSKVQTYISLIPQNRQIIVTKMLRFAQAQIEKSREFFSYQHTTLEVSYELQKVKMALLPLSFEFSSTDLAVDMQVISKDIVALSQMITQIIRLLYKVVQRLIHHDCFFIDFSINNYLALIEVMKVNMPPEIYAEAIDGHTEMKVKLHRLQDFYSINKEFVTYDFLSWAGIVNDLLDTIPTIKSIINKSSCICQLPFFKSTIENQLKDINRLFDSFNTHMELRTVLSFPRMFSSMPILGYTLLVFSSIVTSAGAQVAANAKYAPANSGQQGMEFADQLFELSLAIKYYEEPGNMQVSSFLQKSARRAARDGLLITLDIGDGLKHINDLLQSVKKVINHMHSKWMKLQKQLQTDNEEAIGTMKPPPETNQQAQEGFFLRGLFERDISDDDGGFDGTDEFDDIFDHDNSDDEYSESDGDDEIDASAFPFFGIQQPKQQEKITKRPAPPQWAPLKADISKLEACMAKLRFNPNDTTPIRDMVTIVTNMGPEIEEVEKAFNA